MTSQVSEMSYSTMVRRLDKDTGKQISSAHSTVTLTNQGVLTLTTTSSYVLPVEYKEIVYRLLQAKKE